MPAPSLISLEKRFPTFGECKQSWQVSNHISFSRFYNRIGNTNKMKFNPPNASGHITLNTPVLVRSPKLSNVESSQYLDGWPPGNTGCCWSKPNFLREFQGFSETRDKSQTFLFHFPLREIEKDWIWPLLMPTAISRWTHQFSSDHWS